MRLATFFAVAAPPPLRGGANMDSAGGGRRPPRKFKVKGAPLRPPAHAQTSLCDGLRELELGSAKMMEPTTLLTDLPPDMVQHINLHGATQQTAAVVSPNKLLCSHGVLSWM